MSVVHNKLREDKQWLLKLPDDSRYGPVSLHILREWAAQNRVLPGSLVSTDGRDWVPAETLAALKMEWTTELEDGRLFGPFNIFAVPALVASGALRREARLFNKASGKTIAVTELIGSGTKAVKRPTPGPLGADLLHQAHAHEPAATEAPVPEKAAQPAPTPVATPAPVDNTAEFLALENKYRADIAGLSTQLDRLKQQLEQKETENEGLERLTQDLRVTLEQTTQEAETIRAQLADTSREDQLKQLNAQHEELRRRLAEKEKALEARTLELQAAAGETSGRTQELADEIRRLKREKEALGDEFGVLRTQLEDAQQEQDSLRAALRAREDELASRSAELTDLNTRLQATAAELQHRTHEVQLTADSLGSREKDLSEQIRRLSHEKTEIAGQMRSTQDQLHALQQQQEAVQAALYGREHELCDLRNQLTAAQAEHDSLRAALKIRETERATQAAEQAAIQARLQSTEAELKQRTLEVRQTSDSVGSREKELGEQIRRLSREKTEISDTLETLRNDVRDQQQTQDELRLAVRSRDEEILQLSTRLTDVTGRLDRTVAELEKRKRENDDLFENTSTREQKLGQEVQALTEQKTLLTAELEPMRVKLAEAQRTQDAVQELFRRKDEELQGWVRKLSGYEELLRSKEEIELRLAEVIQQKNKLEARLTETQQALQNTRETAEQLRADATVLEQQIQELAAARATREQELTGKLAHLEAELSRRVSESEQLGRELASTNASYAQLLDQGNQQQNELTASASQQKVELESARSQLATLEKENTDLRRDLDQVHTRATALEETLRERITRAETELVRRNEQVRALEQRLDESLRSVAEAQSAVSTRETTIRQDLERLKAELGAEQQKLKAEQARGMFFKEEAERNARKAENRAVELQEKLRQATLALERSTREIEENRQSATRVLEGTTSQIQQIDSERETLRKTIGDLEQQLSARQAEAGKAVQERTQIQVSLTQRVEELEKRLNEAETHGTRLRDELLARESEARQQAERAALAEQQLESLKTGMAGEMSRLQELESLKLGLQQMKQSADEASRLLSERDAQIQQLKDQGARSETGSIQRLRELEAAAREATEAAERSKVKLSVQQNDNRQLEQKVAGLLQDVKKLHQQLDEQRQQHVAQMGAAVARAAEAGRPLPEAPIAPVRAAATVAPPTLSRRHVAWWNRTPARLAAGIALILFCSLAAFRIGSVNARRHLARPQAVLSEDLNQLRFTPSEPAMPETPPTPPVTPVVPPVPVTPAVVAPAVLPPVQWPAINVERVLVGHEERAATIVFDFGLFSSRTNLSVQAWIALDQLATQLRGKLNEFDLVIEGHTDTTPVSAANHYSDNVGLGQMRADIVLNLLKDSFGLTAGSVTAISAGESNPPFSNETDSSRRKNRTVVIRLTPRTPAPEAAP